MSTSANPVASAKADVDYYTRHVDYYTRRLKEAELVLELAIEAEEREAEERVVQVEFSRGGTTYAYKVPEHWPDLGIGDRVVTPVTYGGGGRGKNEVVMVVGFGRGGYTGPIRELGGRVVR